MAKNPLTYKISSEHVSQKEHALRELRVLRTRIASAETALMQDRPVDTRLIANASGLTETLTRYNLAIELLPYVMKK